ncbi:MAG: hypothetical protein K9N62_15260 [Verrucomicrobia bacterium]|nr:hypothetical protein [Verrucomicrobiota bacterium]
MSGISSGGGEPQTVLIGARSSNPGLVPDPVVSYLSPDSEGSLSYAPLPNQNGNTLITVTVMDAGLDGDLNTLFDNGTITRSFTVVVGEGNDRPTISAIPDFTIDEDGTTGEIAFSVGDTETPAESLAITAESSNLALVAKTGIVLGGLGEHRTVRVTPVENGFGAAIVTLSVVDANGARVTETFMITINAVNDAPTLDAIPDPLAVDEDAGLRTIALTGISAGGAETQEIRISASSSNPNLIPEPTVSHTGPNSTGSLSYTPVRDQSGTAVVTVKVMDAGLDGDLNSSGDNLSVSRTFTVTVNPVNDPPTLAAINNPVAIDEDAGQQTIALTGIGSGSGETQAISISASSNNPGLIPTPSVNYTSPNTTGSVSYTPVANQSGTAVITVTVVDAGLDGDLNSGGDNLSITRTFTVTVNPVNDPPTLAAINDPVAINEDSGLQTIALAGIGSGSGETQTMSISASSNNPGLIPTPSVNYTSPNTTGIVSYTPVANQSGTAVITVTVMDSGLDGDLNSSGDNLLVTRTFTVTVNPVNDPPTLVVINDPVAVNEDSGLQTITLTGIGSGGGETQTISISASSNNPGLIPTPSVNYTSPNTTGTVSYTPVANESGTAVITVTVVDSGLDGELNSSGDNLSVSRTFTVTVNAVNDFPTVSQIADQTINEDGTTGVIAFTVDDIETPAGDLGVAVESSNSLLVPVSGLESGGSGANLTLTIRPVGDAFGTTTVTVKVTDAHGGMVTETFRVTVNAVNDPPSLNGIVDPPPVFDTAAPVTLPIEGIGAGAGEVQELRVLAVSSDPDIVPDPVVNYRTPDSAGSLTYAPVRGKTGTSTITVSVMDAGLDGNLATAEDNGVTTRTFLVTVEPLPVGNLKLSGTISYYSGNQSVPNATLGLVGDLIDEVGTDASGSFEFVGLGSLARISVVPLGKTETRSWHGLTSLDLALMKRHILGVKALDSPQQLLAADVNGSGSITMMDVLILWREILALPVSFPVGRWRFVPTAYQFPAPEQPWDAPAFRVYAGIPSDLNGQDFSAIKLGDVDGSWKPVEEPGLILLASVLPGPMPGAMDSRDDRETKLPGASESFRRSLLRETVPGVAFKAGRVRPVDESVDATGLDVFVPVTVSKFSEVTSLQFTLQWDPALYEFVGVGDFSLPGLEVGNFGARMTSQGALKVLWFVSDRTGVSVDDETALFTVHLRALTRINQAAVWISTEPAVREVSVRFEPVRFDLIEQEVVPGDVKREKL